MPTIGRQKCPNRKSHLLLLFATPPGPAKYDVEGVTYLTPADQEALPYRIIKLLPWKHFGRKNVGYLYAVHHGAKVCSAVP